LATIMLFNRLEKKVSFEELFIMIEMCDFVAKFDLLYWPSCTT